MIEANAPGPFVDAVSLALLLSGLLLVATPRLTSALVLVAAQSALLATIALAIAISTGSLHVYVAAALTILVKVIVGPWVLLKRLPDIRLHRETPLALPTRVALLIAAVLVLIAYRSVGDLDVPGSVPGHQSLPVSVSLMLMGLFVMILRRKAMFQVLGLLTMENGVYLVALVVTLGLPLSVELAVLFDVLIGIFVMGMFIGRISDSFDTINTDRMRRLRG